jgi:hypothetical protein
MITMNNYWFARPEDILFSEYSIATRCEQNDSRAVMIIGTGYSNDSSCPCN